MRLDVLPSELWDFGPVDMLRGLLTALSPGNGRARTSIDIPALGPCLPIRTARVAIVLALKALGLSLGARVGVPLYCCPVVFKAIKAAGCTARFIDVDPETCCMSAADLDSKVEEVDAVIAVHMFGHLCNMDQLRASARGKPIIEDCAQALGSTFNGRSAGSFGDVAALSFHSGKYVSVGEGGALYSSDTDLRSRLSELIAQLPAPSRRNECVHVAETFLKSSLRSRPLWGLAGERVWRAYGERVDYTSQSPVAITKMFETDRAAVIRRLPHLDAWILRQRANADYYNRRLTVARHMVCWEPPGAFYNRLQYPLLVPTTEQCGRLAAYLRGCGIGTARPYRHIAAIALEHYGYAGDCPQAERVARTVLVIPCNHSLNGTDIERVAECVNRGWTQVS